MRIGRDVAFTLLRGWRDDRTPLRCDCRLAGVTVTVLVRIESVTDDELRFRDDDDERAVVRVPLAPDFDFWYEDMRAFPDLDRQFAGGLTLLFPFTSDPGEADRIILSERRA